MIDLYDSKRRLEAARNRLSKLPCGDVLLAFLEHLKALGLSDKRVLKYADSLSTLFRNVPFNPAGASRRDVERVVAWINAQSYKNWTKHDLKLALRKLVQYARLGSCAEKTPIPAEVDWIPMKVDERDCRVKPESLLTVDDIKALMMRAENRRDRALVAVFFEAALRPAELLGMKVGSVEFKENYCIITVNGKTGVKRIPIVASHRPLLEWLEEHPRKDDIEAPLWASLSNNAKGNRVSYYYLRKLLQRLAKKAGLKKEVWPYLLRHSCLTSLAKIFTESKLKLYAGWVMESRMVKRYVHFSARDLEEAVLELHGLKEANSTSHIFKLNDCPRCGQKNPPDNVRCSFCGYIMDKNLATEMEEKHMERMEEILKRLERLEEVVRSFLLGKT